MPLLLPLSSCFVCSWSYSSCLQYHCWHPTVVHVIYSLFVLPFVVPPAPSPQYIGAAYFAGCIIQPKIRVHYAHTHPVQKVWVWLLVTFCTWLAHLFKFFQPFFPFVWHFTYLGCRLLSFVVNCSASSFGLPTVNCHATIYNWQMLWLQCPHSSVSRVLCCSLCHCLCVSLSPLSIVAPPWHEIADVVIDFVTVQPFFILPMHPLLVAPLHLVGAIDAC